MSDIASAAENYVNRKYGPPTGQDGAEPIAWRDGDLLDAFIAGASWARDQSPISWPKSQPGV